MLCTMRRTVIGDLATGSPLLVFGRIACVISKRSNGAGGFDAATVQNPWLDLGKCVSYMIAEGPFPFRWPYIQN